MSEKRFCKVCQSEEFQDKTKRLQRNSNPEGVGMRIFMGVLSLGTYELVLNTYYTCQKCNSITK